MQAFLTRHALLFILLLGVVAAGCSPNAFEDVIRDGPRDTQHYRIDADINRYVSEVDREIMLDRRQEELVVRMLRDRTYRLLDRARRSELRYIYPFPRRTYRDMNSVQRDFWLDADRQIERRLTHSQARRYAYITGRDRYQRSLYTDRYEVRRRVEPRVRSTDRGRYEPRGETLGRDGTREETRGRAPRTDRRDDERPRSRDDDRYERRGGDRYERDDDDR